MSRHVPRKLEGSTVKLELEQSGDIEKTIGRKSLDDNAKRVS